MSVVRSPTLFAGIDLGTSGVRGVCVDAQLVTHASAMVAFTENDDRRNPALWWKAIQQLIQELLTQVSASAVKAIAIDGTSGTMVGIDANGRPIGKALLYNDACTDQGIVDKIAICAPESSAVHGVTSGLARAITLSAQPSVAGIAHEADWVACQLSGISGVSDENNALKTGYDAVAREWPGWIKDAGLAVQLLPQVLPAGTLIGPISRQAADATGLDLATQVFTGTTDGCASFLATGAAVPGDGVTVLGSTLTIKLLSDKPVYAPQFGIYSHRIGNRWLAGGASNTGGQVLAHYFQPDEIERLSRQIDPREPTHLDYYPLLSPGERFPINDSQLQPRLSPVPETDRQFLHGMLKGIANIERLAYTRLRELGAPSLASIRTVGGGAKNPVWTTIREDVLKVRTNTCISEQAAVGTASLARDGYLEQ